MTKKSYKPREKTLQVQQAILDIFDEMRPRLTVRQIYYALTVRGIIPKNENGYRQACYQLKLMRLNGQIPYGWIADNTRWQIKPMSFGGLKDALAHWHGAYRRDLWLHQNVYIEIWVEKDALAGVISPITQEFDVPLMVARGYSSMTFAHDAAEEIKAIDKPAYIYHFGDFDPSGVDAAYKIRDELQNHGAKIHFHRMAVTEEQIKIFDLPTRETKKSDPRAKKWGNKPSVELDALPAPTLRQLVRNCIIQHIDPDTWNKELETEELERKTLEALRIENFVQVQNSNKENEL